MRKKMVYMIIWSITPRNIREVKLRSVWNESVMTDNIVRLVSLSVAEGKDGRVSKFLFPTNIPCFLKAPRVGVNLASGNVTALIH